MARDSQGREQPIPGPGLVTVLQRVDRVWKEVALEDPHCKVLHKAQFIDSAPLRNKILTISGTQARLCAWERKNGLWKPDLLWNPTFGGYFNRLRDFELGDLDGDGTLDIVVGTHDQGVIAHVRHVQGEWQAREIDRKPDTFIHEIELGDTDGDGRLEVFATPSKPNRATLVSQPGQIVQYKIDGERILKRTIADLPDTHCKEILVTDLDQDGKDEVVAAIEARTQLQGGRTKIIEPVQIVLFRESHGSFTTTTLAEIPDRLCRVLCAGDVNLDGRIDIVLTGMESGVWWLQQTNDRTWKLDLIDPNSSGIEHAATLCDVDTPGEYKIYVVSERERVLREYTWTGSKFEGKPIASLPENQLTFSITGSSMPSLQ